MIDITATRRNHRRTAEINMAPLIDMVFLLLIFFMVTTSFVKETGIDVHRPTASTAQLVQHLSTLAPTRVTMLDCHDGIPVLDLQAVGDDEPGWIGHEEIEAMYASGVRTFVEVGPGSVLTGLVGRHLLLSPKRENITGIRSSSRYFLSVSSPSIGVTEE